MVPLYYASLGIAIPVCIAMIGIYSSVHYRLGLCIVFTTMYVIILIETLRPDMV